MEVRKPLFCGLTGNQLKIIALVAMTCDHVEKMLLPQFMVLQIIGRFAFPVFAYMIAEGCVHAKSKKKYFLTMVCAAAVCQIGYGVALGSLFQCVLVTFSLSIALIFLIDYARKKRTFPAYAGCFAGIMLVSFVCVTLPYILYDTDFEIDYGLIGVLIPVAIYLGKTQRMKLVILAVMLVLLSLKLGGLQWYGAGAVLLLAMYNGQRGKMKMKYLFYIYYPLHLVGIYLIGLVVF